MLRPNLLAHDSYVYIDLKKLSCAPLHDCPSGGRVSQSQRFRITLCFCIRFSKTPSIEELVSSFLIASELEMTNQVTNVRMELDGIEPTTPGLQSRCSPN